jgi:glycosyltransferase involved in cell wall biosynthesis
MHLAIVTHRFVRGDGQGRVNLEIAHVAAAHGHTVSLVASEVDRDVIQHPRIHWIPIHVGQLPTELIRNQVFAWKSNRWLTTYRNTLDCVISNGCITWTPADINIAHFVHSAWLRSSGHTAYSHSGAYGWYQWIYTWLNALWERRAYRQAKTVVAVSDAVRHDLESAGTPPSSIVTIPNGVDLDEFHPSPVDAPKGSPSADGPVGLFVGDLRTRRKNLDTVLRALQDVPDFHLLVAGDTSDSPYPALASTLGLSDRVHFLGYAQNIPALMRAADVCICPSRYEPFSLVAFESLASGTPVITSRNVGAARYLSPECAWIIDDPEDHVSLAAAVKELAKKTRQDPSRIASMRSAARQQAENYSFTRMTERYLHLMENRYATNDACSA